MSDLRHHWTRAEMEMEISRVLIRFEKECMGRGPLETKTYVIDDMIIVRLKDVLTPAERQLAQADNGRSQYLLKQVRNELLSRGRPMLEVLIRDIAGVEVQSIHTDISTKTGERIIVFTLHGRPNFKPINGERHGHDDRSLAERVSAR